jgi:Flp pilus assembly protein TadG
MRRDVPLLPRILTVRSPTAPRAAKPHRPMAVPRQAVAAVEFAILAPFLAFLFVIAVD